MSSIDLLGISYFLLLKHVCCLLRRASPSFSNRQFMKIACPLLPNELPRTVRNSTSVCLVCVCVCIPYTCKCMWCRSLAFQAVWLQSWVQVPGNVRAVIAFATFARHIFKRSLQYPVATEEKRNFCESSVSDQDS